jgi:diguanylate cyclase (GGDEF)-like protein
MLRQLKTPLFKRLTVALLIAACVVLSARLLVRVYWEIPQYLSMEMDSDQKEAARVENALATRIAELFSLFQPSSVWDDMHHYAQNPNDLFISAYFSNQDWQASLTDGVFIINLEKQLLWSYLSPSLLKAASQVGLSKNDLVEIAQKQTQLPNALETEDVPTGLQTGLNAPLAFVSLPIYPSQYQGEISGFLVAWDYLDKDTQELLQEILQTNFSVKALPATESNLPDIFSNLQRDNNNQIRWSISDHQGKKAFAAEIDLGARRFNDNLITTTTAIEISAAFITFIILALMLTRHIITPIQTLQKSMQDIHSTQDYSARINCQRSDEFGELSREYDALLQHIQHQESALRASNNELLQLSNMDALTGIANRRAFDNFLTESQEQLPVSLLLIDIDHFKQFNDHYGHQAGDSALQAVATALHRNSLSSTDLVARYGGEEFAIVLTGTHQRQARQVAERMINAIRKLQIAHTLSNHKYVSISVGLATATEHFTTAVLIEEADDALYSAKDQGRNRVVMAT